MKRLTHLFRTNKKELFISFLALLCLTIFVPIFTYAYFASDLKSKQTIMNNNDTGVILLDRNNKPFFTLYQAAYKQFIPRSQIPESLQQAVIASEDKDFYKHSGFSLQGIIRAFTLNLQQNQTLYGGSTITQQLVKNVLLNSNKNYLRKVQEIILAQEIERRYSKDEILEMYLNSVYFGEGAFGVENAAQAYFGKHAKDLTIPEQAFLAGLLPSPSKFSPFWGNYKGGKLRQEIVLQKMYEQNYISKEAMEQAKKATLVFRPQQSDVNAVAPHFALMVKKELIKKYGEENISRSGLRVKTSIDLTWQKEAEQAVADQVIKLKGNNVSNGAAVVMDPKTGDIKALVGSADWYNEKNGKINMAEALRSVGSSFKPIIYAAAIERGLITPATILHDVPTNFGGDYKPQNYDRKFRGPVTTRRALANSLNVPAVEVMKKVGLENGLDMAHRLGVHSLKEPSYYGQGLSLVLGTGEISLIEITNVYATFANNGVRTEPKIILEISDKTGKNVYRAPQKHIQALQPQVAFLISSILSDNKARAEIFSNLLTISRPAAVKTGTAESYRDALTLGYTPSLAIGVWVGNNDNTPMDTVAGSLGAAPIWKTLMEKFLAGTAIETFTPPVGIVQAAPCRYHPLLVASPSAQPLPTTEYYLKGTENIMPCPSPLPTSSPLPTTPTGNFSENGEQLRNEIEQKIRERMQRIEERRKDRN